MRLLLPSFKFKLSSNLKCWMIKMINILGIKSKLKIPKTCFISTFTFFLVYKTMRTLLFVYFQSKTSFSTYWTCAPTKMTTCSSDFDLKKGKETIYLPDLLKSTSMLQALLPQEHVFMQ